MNLFEMKKKVFGLIEEYNPESEYLTDDPDLQVKINEVINQRMYELARYKKISKYVEMQVDTGDVITFEDIEKACGYVVYQVGNITGIGYEARANNTVYKVREGGLAELDVFVYPERIAANTKDKAYEFELSEDVLEIMPYGVAADLLMSDKSVDNGKIYAQEYERMKQMLDTRYATQSITIEGGVYI